MQEINQRVIAKVSGSCHFIAIMGETADEITIGDPMKGKFVVKRCNLKSYYHFTGFFLAVQPK